MFTGIPGVWPVSANLTETDEPERIETALVDANYFADARRRRAAWAACSTRPTRSPGITEVAVISDALWQPAVRRRSERARQADPDRQRHVHDHRGRAGVVPSSGTRH